METCFNDARAKNVSSPRQPLAYLWPFCSRFAWPAPAYWYMGSEFVFLCTENTQVCQDKQELPGQNLTDLTVNKTETM